MTKTSIDRFLSVSKVWIHDHRYYSLQYLQFWRASSPHSSQFGISNPFFCLYIGLITYFGSPLNRICAVESWGDMGKEKPRRKWNLFCVETLVGAIFTTMNQPVSFTSMAQLAFVIYDSHHLHMNRRNGSICYNIQGRWFSSVSCEVSSKTLWFIAVQFRLCALFLSILCNSYIQRIGFWMTSNCCQNSIATTRGVSVECTAIWLLVYAVFANCEFILFIIRYIIGFRKVRPLCKDQLQVKMMVPFCRNHPRALYRIWACLEMNI